MQYDGTMNQQINRSAIGCTDRKNVTNFLYLVLHLACKAMCYFHLLIQFAFGLSTIIDVLSKSKSRNYVN